MVKRSRDRYPLSERLQRMIFLSSRSRGALPPETAREKELRETLRSEMEKLPFEKPNRKSNAENKWISFKNKIREYVKNDDPRMFVSWPPIRFNMHYVPRRFEINTIKKSPLAAEFTRALRIESSSSIPCYAMPEASENGIRQAFHLDKFLSVTGVNLSEIDQVFEFGGGYGSMCLLASRLGFHGRYVVFDWPEFSAIQKYYLSRENIDRSMGKAGSGADIIFLNEIKDIARVIDKNKRTLLIATWSLSECSVELRETIFNETSASYFLITYQKEFGGINNEKYFTEFCESHPDIEWKVEPASFWEPSQRNKYLLGVRKNRD